MRAADRLAWRAWCTAAPSRRLSCAALPARRVPATEHHGKNDELRFFDQMETENGESRRA